MAVRILPSFKVTVTHSGSDTDYENETFTTIQVKRPENNVSSAVLLADNRKSRLYDSAITTFDELKIYVKDNAVSGGSYSQVFGGNVRQLQPLLTNNGALLRVFCKGYGQALMDTHCNQDYGLESSLGTSADTAKEIVEHLVDNYINESFDDEPHAANTGYAITKTKISDLVSGTTISYINNPYRRCFDVLNNVCQLVTAIRAGSAGAHWMVDTSKNLRFEYIGTSQDGWADWWRANQAGSTVVEGVDFKDFQIVKKTEEFSNHVVFITDFRRPSYDYWTEDSGGVALWGSSDLDVFEDNATHVVGSHSVKMHSDAAEPHGVAYYPSGQTANWDVTKWGTEKSVPTISFYMQKDDQLDEAQSSISLRNDNNNYFICYWDEWTDADDTWVHKSIPIGPYWSTVEESKTFVWEEVNSPVWTDIDYIYFIITPSGGAGATLYLDDLHFAGKIIRSAYNSTSISANKEVQKVIISRSAMDDTGVAATHTGTAARYAYAELLRRQTIPVTITFRTWMQSDLLPGQKLHVHACETLAGAYELDSDMRVTMHELDISSEGFLSTVTATSDLLNSFPMTGADQYELLTEYLLLNNREATDIRAGGEVDLLVPMLAKNYG